MKGFELVVAAVLVAMGIRSAITWARRPFPSRDPVDHLLYALYLTGRVGMWFAFAGAFVIFGLTRTQGRAFIDDAGEFRWYVLVFILLGVLQMLGGWFLGRRDPDGKP